MAEGSKSPESGHKLLRYELMIRVLWNCDMGESCINTERPGVHEEHNEMEQCRAMKWLPNQNIAGIEIEETSKLKDKVMKPEVLLFVDRIVVERP